MDMAAAPDAVVEAAAPTGIFGQNTAVLTNMVLLALGVAAVVAVMVVFWLWSQQPEYRVLFSNYADKDGGAIVASLEQMNIPYKFSESGTAILVPASQVHQVRLKLAAQGLPKGGNIGFELLENQKFGVSQFVEQVNFQRGLEGELERSIQTISAVEVARIHLAIPKPSVFVRDQQKPTASVLLNLRPGRMLDQQQVSAIVHLVASSVPELPIANVTVVDQNGNLLSDTDKKAGRNNLDPTQLKYVDELQQNIVRRVESIIAPMVGAKNVHAEASAEVDFSTQEQAAETYRPNQAPDAMSVRSQQSNESQSTSPAGAGGVPGALSNQPPAPATAPLNTAVPANAGAPGAGTPANAAAANGANATPAVPVNSQKNVTTNYELDKTIRYVQQPMGGVKRLTVAVVVNHKQVVDKKGKITNRPLTDAEKAEISELAKQAMGFNQERGDSLTVVNSSFAGEEVEAIPELPLWKQPENIEMAKEWLKMAAGLLVIFLLYRKLMKPMMQKLVKSDQKEALPAPGDDDAAVVTLSGDAEGAEGENMVGVPRKLAAKGYEQNLEAAKQLAKENPKLVASLVTSWVSKE
jgi:flagellar M-ring protein FliF